MSATYYAQNAIIQRYFGGVTSVAAPSTWSVALFTSAPNESGGGTEVSGGAYARQSVANDQSTGFNAASDGDVTNKSAIEFPEATSSWGAVSHVGFYDASNNLWFYSALTQTKTVDTGTTVYFSAGTLAISANN